jgi:transcriptional regulator with XRE-family HTH domain
MEDSNDKEILKHYRKDLKIPEKTYQEIMYEEADNKLKQHLKLISLLTDVAADIANYRRNIGLSQKEFAEKFNVSQPMISKLESGKYNFTIKKLNEIICKLGGELKIETNLVSFENEDKEMFEQWDINEDEELFDTLEVKRSA